MAPIKKLICCFTGKPSGQSSQEQQQTSDASPEKFDVPKLLRHLRNTLDVPDYPQPVERSGASSSQPQQQQKPSDDSSSGGFRSYFRKKFKLPDRTRSTGESSGLSTQEKQQGATSSQPQQKPSDASVSGMYSWDEVLEGTNQLDNTTHLIGEGNFGRVYRCHFLRTNKVGAVKIGKLNNTYKDEEYNAEITTLEAANHPNVIKLLGKCADPSYCVIIYEFMPKGSLDHYLYDPINPSRRGAPIIWETRMRIAVGIAEALVYLHENLKVIHRDLKAGNVLLDDNYVPKLTDFGLVTKVDRDNKGNENVTTLSIIKGTPGCTAPETESDGYVSTETDVYSYGVLLLTLVTAKKPHDRSRSLGLQKLTQSLGPAWSRDENMRMVVDPRLGDRYPVKGLKQVFNIAKFCINPQRTLRPSMSMVRTMIQEAANVPVPQLSQPSVAKGRRSMS